jgi:flagellar hook-basal body complex protein FliE
MSDMQINQVLAQIRSLSAGGVGLNKPVAPTAGKDAVSGPAFGDLLRKSLDSVNESQTKAATLADQYERGVGNVDLATVMIESQKASVSFRALTEVRNRLVNVYQDIMNMPI